MEWMCLRCRNFNRTLAFTHYEHCGISFCYANRMHKTVFVHPIKCVNEKIIEMLVLWALCCFAPNPFSFPPSHAMFLFSSFSSFQLQSSRFYFKLFAVQQQYLSVCDCLRFESMCICCSLFVTLLVYAQQFFMAVIKNWPPLQCWDIVLDQELHAPKSLPSS